MRTAGMKTAATKSPMPTATSGRARRLASGTTQPRATISSTSQTVPRLRSGKPRSVVWIAFAWISGRDLGCVDRQALQPLGRVGHLPDHVRPVGREVGVAGPGVELVECLAVEDQHGLTAGRDRRRESHLPVAVVDRVSEGVVLGDG